MGTSFGPLTDHICYGRASKVMWTMPDRLVISCGNRDEVRTALSTAACRRAGVVPGPARSANERMADGELHDAVYMVSPVANAGPHPPRREQPIKESTRTGGGWSTSAVEIVCGCRA